MRDYQIFMKISIPFFGTYLNRDLLTRHGFLHLAVHERVMYTQTTEDAKRL
jgi:hypothetical protein